MSRGQASLLARTAIDNSLWHEAIRDYVVLY